MALLPVPTALKQILAEITPLPSETVHISQGWNRVLAEDVVSPENIPPFPNSAMDGYAVRAADIAAANRTAPVILPVTGSIAAGAAAVPSLTPGTAVRIMTGAPVPDGADTVIRFEDTSEFITHPNLPDDHVAFFEAAPQGANVRHTGEDISAGKVVLRKGYPLRPQDIGVLAAIGRAEVAVTRRPRVGILATGDELIDLDESLSPGKIRNSNGYTQAAQIAAYGATPIPLGIARDTNADLVSKLEAGLAQGLDLLITSAGVSAGDYDVVKNVLKSRGAMHFWQVDIKPGKPLAFGNIDGVPLIGLPGNPVASVVAFEVFARAAILKLAGYASVEKPVLKATLTEDVTNSGRQHYMRAYLYCTGTDYRVTTRGSGVTVQGSGILSSLVWANVLLVVPSGTKFLPAGSKVDAWLLDWHGPEIPTSP